MSTDDKENLLIDFLGIDYFDDISFILKNFKPIKFKKFNKIEHNEFTELTYFTKEIEKDTELIPVSTIFNGEKYFNFKYFNAVQSTTFNFLYNSDQNAVICAPTGCGKTNLAVLAILRLMKSVDTNKVRVVYIAPMKALATEITYKLQKLFPKVYEFTGDTHFISELKEAFILVSTPEKFEVITRRFGNIYDSISLVIVDEIHLLGDDRGPVLESVICRIFRLVEYMQKHIRVIALSATLTNKEDVGNFIKGKVFNFGEQFRQTQLQISLYGCYGKVKKRTLQENKSFDEVIKENELDTEKDKEENRLETEENKLEIENILTRDTKASHFNLLSVLITEIENIYLKKEQAIIFVHSRAETFNIANKIHSLFKGNQNKETFKNSFLTKIINHGVGIHNAGLERKIRLKMEDLFLKNKIQFLIATSTLAWGVNLPAKHVIIKGTEFYDSKSGNFKEISWIDILQMFGRAGRPQFMNNEIGKAILITSKNKLDNFAKILLEQPPLESSFLESLIDFLNAEISLGTINDPKEANNWLYNTFLYQRAINNPKRYGIDKSISEVFSEWIELGIRRLLELELIKKLDFKTNNFDEKNLFFITDAILPTNVGRIASQLYIKHETMNLFLKNLKQSFDFSVLNLMFNCKELENIILRDNELIEINDLLGKGNIDEIVLEDKLFLLVNCAIDKTKLISFGLLNDQKFLVTNLCRMLQAFLLVVIMKDEISTFCKVYELYFKMRNADNWLNGINISFDFKEVLINGSKTCEENNSEQKVNLNLDSKLEFNFEYKNHFLRVSIRNGSKKPKFVILKIQDYQRIELFTITLNLFINLKEQHPVSNTLDLILNYGGVEEPWQILKQFSIPKKHEIVLTRKVNFEFYDLINFEKIESIKRIFYFIVKRNCKNNLLILFNLEDLPIFLKYLKYFKEIENKDILINDSHINYSRINDSKVNRNNLKVVGLKEYFDERNKFDGWVKMFYKLCGFDNCFIEEIVKSEKDFIIFDYCTTLDYYNEFKMQAN